METAFPTLSCNFKSPHINGDLKNSCYQKELICIKSYCVFFFSIHISAAKFGESVFLNWNLFESDHNFLYYKKWGTYLAWQRQQVEITWTLLCKFFKIPLSSHSHDQKRLPHAIKENRKKLNSFIHNEKYYHHQNYKEVFTWNDTTLKYFSQKVSAFLHLIRMSHCKNQCFSNAFPAAVMTLKGYLLHRQLPLITTIISPFYSSIKYSHKTLWHKSWSAL